MAANSAFEIIVVDESKVVTQLGAKYPVPVEVVAFGWRRTRAALEALGAQTLLRGPHGAPHPWPAELPAEDVEHPFVTDGGNFILDCHWDNAGDMAELAARVKAITGVVEHGIFIGLAHRVVVAGSGGIQVYEKGQN